MFQNAGNGGARSQPRAGAGGVGQERVGGGGMRALVYRGGWQEQVALGGRKRRGAAAAEMCAGGEQRRRRRAAQGAAAATKRGRKGRGPRALPFEKAPRLVSTLVREGKGGTESWKRVGEAKEARRRRLMMEYAGGVGGKSCVAH